MIMPRRKSSQGIWLYFLQDNNRPFKYRFCK
uniref:Uncharacterized protein n=1 Tax=Medicago truncatula TaxID=3880 RepID=B7FG28_MEDTR|nr:unknown [Medicago truncatula]